MTSKRETVLQALHNVLLGLPHSAVRGGVLPERLPANGLFILRDGEPGEPDVTMSPLTYHYEHKAEVEAIIQISDHLDTNFDLMTSALGAAINGDRTLGGLCDWVEAKAPQPVDLPMEGVAHFKAAIIPVHLHYSTGDPLA